MKRSLLIKLHLYCGLFTIFYLVAFGFSSILLNHKLSVDNQSVINNWEVNLPIETELTDHELAESIKDRLGFMGWTPYWEFQKDPDSFRFLVTHPGRDYRIEHNLHNGLTQVEEIPKGFWAVLHGLHFFNGNIPNAPFFLRTWAVYQWLTLMVMLVSLILGLWLWLRYHYRPWEGVVFGGLVIFTLLIMILI